MDGLQQLQSTYWLWMLIKLIARWRFLTVLFRKINSVLRLDKIGSSNHQFTAADIKRSLNDVFKVIVMSLLSMIFTPKYRITKIDANLKMSTSPVEIGHDAYIGISEGFLLCHLS